MLFPYYLIKDKINLDNETLSSIGGYVSGGVSILNLFVFVYLTILIARYENIKSNNEIKSQKIIVQSQFRQSELEKLIIELDKPFDTSQPSDSELSIYRFSKAHVVVNNFLNRNQYLFPIFNDKRYFEMGNNIATTFIELIEFVESKDKNEEKFHELFIKLLDQKSRFIHVLQVFIIDELER